MKEEEEENREEEQEENDLDRICKWREFLDHNLKTSEESHTYDVIFALIVPMYTTFSQL